MLDNQAVFLSFLICFVSNNTPSMVYTGKIIDVTVGQDGDASHLPTPPKLGDPRKTLHLSEP